MPGVIPKPGEVLESLIRRYKRICEKSGILAQVRRREHYVKPTETRKRDFAAAVKRARKRLMREKPSFLNSLAKKKRKH